MWDFLWNVFRGLAATFLMALVLDYIGRKRKISWIINQSKKKIIAFVWALEIAGVFSFFVLFETKLIVLFALVWIVFLVALFEISKIWKFDSGSETTFSQIIFCIVLVPIIGAFVFFLSIFMDL